MTYSFKVEPGFREWINARAKRDGMTVNEWIELAFLLASETDMKVAKHNRKWVEEQLAQEDAWQYQ